jgi:hypothetical protein
MSDSDSELVHAVHRRARRAMVAGVAALNAFRSSKGKGRSVPHAPEAVHEALSLGVMRFLVLLLGRARGLCDRATNLAGGRLFSVRDAKLNVHVSVQDGQLASGFSLPFLAAQAVFHAELETGLASDGVDFAACPAELVGNLYELLLGESVRGGSGQDFELSSGKKRKQTGTFFTPRALTQVVVARALEPLERRIRGSSHRAHDFVLEFKVCDPAVGGGAFLLEVARALLARSGSASAARAALQRRRAIVSRVLHGVDVNPIAVAVAEAALWLFVADPQWSLLDAGRHLRVGDALLGEPRTPLEPARTAPRSLGAVCDFPLEFPDVFERGGFDLVIGNPPWVAYAGRAAQPLEPARKAYFSAHYASLRGYPTLHGLFVERALRLAPQGTVALVVPSPIADLVGYRAVRRVVRSSHTPCEPMLEFGQDAFESVTQPCFALIAEASTASTPREVGESPFRLEERQRAGAVAAEILPPAALSQIAKWPPFPRELFGEMGFQTTSAVTRNLLRRAETPDARHDYPLLEGRDVREFSEGEPRLFLAPDVQALAAARCRVRDKNDYQRVRFVIRQTARYPIAALHRGLPFRNSLLAGFAVDGLPPGLVVGLLNSSLYRALHLAFRRDARQAAFPQVKIAHLRALPLPPHDPDAQEQITRLTAELTHDGVAPGVVDRLDSAVFGLFSLESSIAKEILDFLAARGVLRH